MKLIRFFVMTMMCGCLGVSFAGCTASEGDNSDYDFGDQAVEEPENPYDGTSYDREPGTWRLATYNTHRCEGLVSNAGIDRANYDNTAQVILRMNPDVIALQELDRQTSWHAADQLQELARRTGLYPTFCKTVSQRGGDYGIGVLSREHPLSTDSGNLPGAEARKYLILEFSDFYFIATHFDYEAGIPDLSIAIISRYLKDNYADVVKPIYLAGDLNTAEFAAGSLDDWEIVSTSQATFPSKGTRIDYILVWKDNTPSYEVLRTAVPAWSDFNVQTVSDHLPVLVDLKK